VTQEKEANRGLPDVEKRRRKNKKKAVASVTTSRTGTKKSEHFSMAI